MFDTGLATAAFLGGLAVVAGALPGRAATWAALVWLMYLADRMSGGAEDLHDRWPDRSPGLARALLGCLIGSVLAGLVLFPAAIGGAVVLTAVGVLYFKPVPGFPRLKELPAVKAAVAATLLAGGAVCVAGAPVGWSTPALWLLIWVNVSLYDVRDRNADRAAGVRTLAVLLKPVVHGTLLAIAMAVVLGLSWGIGGPFWGVMWPVGVLHLGGALWVRRHAFPDILDLGLDGGSAALVLAHLIVGA